MLVVISPAKNLDYDSPLPTEEHTQTAYARASAGVSRPLPSVVSTATQSTDEKLVTSWRV